MECKLQRSLNSTSDYTNETTKRRVWRKRSLHCRMTSLPGIHYQTRFRTAKEKSSVMRPQLIVWGNNLGEPRENLISWRQNSARLTDSGRSWGFGVWNMRSLLKYFFQERSKSTRTDGKKREDSWLQLIIASSCSLSNQNWKWSGKSLLSSPNTNSW